MPRGFLELSPYGDLEACGIDFGFSVADIREMSKAVNFNLMKLVTHMGKGASSESGGDLKLDQPILDLISVIDVLTRNLQNTAVPTKTAVLRWIYHLHLKMPSQMFLHVDETFPVLLKTLSDPSDEVVLLSLEVIAEIVSFSSKLKRGGKDLLETEFKLKVKFLKMSLAGISEC